MRNSRGHGSELSTYPFSPIVVEAPHDSLCLCVSGGLWCCVCGMIVLRTSLVRCARSLRVQFKIACQFKEFFAHLRHSMMADANTTFECQVQIPERRAMRSQQENLISKSLEMRGLLDALCKVFIDAGVISEQWLFAEVHQPSFAAVRRSHSCGWSTSLGRAFQSREVAHNTASFVVNKRALWACAQRPKPSPLPWQRCPQRGSGQKVPLGEAMDLPKIPSRFSTRFPTRGTHPHRRNNTNALPHQRGSTDACTSPRLALNVTRLLRSSAGQLADFDADVTGTDRTRCCREWRSVVCRRWPKRLSSSPRVHRSF